MSENQVWYQNGWIMLFLVVFGAPWGLSFYDDYRKSQLPLVFPEVAASQERPLWDGPILHLTVWHQVEGNLRNGSIVVSVEGEVMGEDNSNSWQTHSFEIWHPNRDNGVDFEVPLPSFGPEDQLEVTVRINAKNCRDGRIAATWSEEGWKRKLKE